MFSHRKLVICGVLKLIVAISSCTKSYSKMSWKDTVLFILMASKIISICVSDLWKNYREIYYLPIKYLQSKLNYVSTFPHNMHTHITIVISIPSLYLNTIFWWRLKFNLHQVFHGATVIWYHHHQCSLSLSIDYPFCMYSWNSTSSWGGEWWCSIWLGFLELKTVRIDGIIPCQGS